VKALHSAVEIEDLLMGELLDSLATGGATFGEVEQRLDLSQRESHLLGSLDEPNHRDTVGFIRAISGVAPGGFGQQPAPFVVPEGLDVDPGFRRDLTRSHGRSLNPVPKYRVKASAVPTKEVLDPIPWYRV
jgi:hypothetical protein